MSLNLEIADMINAKKANAWVARRRKMRARYPGSFR